MGAIHISLPYSRNLRFYGKTYWPILGAFYLRYLWVKGLHAFLHHLRLAWKLDSWQYVSGCVSAPAWSRPRSGSLDHCASDASRPSNVLGFKHSLWSCRPLPVLPYIQPRYSAETQGGLRILQIEYIGALVRFNLSGGTTAEFSGFNI